MGSRGLGVVLIGAALLVGCGDDDDDGGGAAQTTQETAQDAKPLDAAAKGDARELASYVESCFVDEQDYSLCRRPAGIDPGTATVEKASMTTYEIVATSESGNEFRLTRAEDGAITRTCTEPESGGCGPAGVW